MTYSYLDESKRLEQSCKEKSTINITKAMNLKYGNWEAAVDDEVHFITNFPSIILFYLDISDVKSNISSGKHL